MSKILNKQRKNKIYMDGMRELSLGTKRFENGKEWKTPRPESANSDSCGGGGDYTCLGSVEKERWKGGGGERKKKRGCDTFAWVEESH
jgi:hypothetical protein